MTTKTLTVRLPVNLYSYICDMAGEIGIPISTFIRSCIEKEHDISALDRMRCELLKRIDELNSNISDNGSNDNRSTEMLYLLRAIAADRNPQIMQQVQARLNQLQPIQRTDSND